MNKTIRQIHQFLFNCLKKIGLPLAIVVIGMAIIFSVFRALTPWVKQYKGQVEHHLSLLLGQPVTIQDLETSWYWFQPVLRMDQVSVSDQADHVLKFNKLLVGIDLWSSLWHWQVQPGILYVDDAHLTVRQMQGHWELDGLKQNQQAMTLEPAHYLPVLSWLLEQQKIIIKHVSATIHLQDGSLLPIQDLNFTAIQHYGHYRLSGHARLAQTTPTTVAIIADLKMNAPKLSQLNGQAYIAVQHFFPLQWRNFFPQTPYQIKQGQGDMRLWLDINKGQITQAQSKLDLHNLVWTEAGKKSSRFLQKLQANTAWKKTNDGWQFSADQIHLQAGGYIWPENALQINFNASQESYRLFVKKLVLQAALAADVEWPPLMLPLISMAPQGELSDLQLGITNNQIDYLLTRFNQLDWQQTNDIPAVSHISGVLYWQPTEGRLELDGENTIIEKRGLPPVTFNLLNAAFDWKDLNQGLRITMERFVLSHPRLLLSAQGAFDNPTSPTLGNIRLSAEFAMKNAQKWLPYLPDQYLKPKLNTWLKHDIKRIAVASGRMVVNGPLKDFPFDKQPGEFSITSHLNGVDLLINKQWPINRDIDADLHVNKRTLEAEILHAELQGALVDKINLSIPDIGLGQEALLLHGEVEAPAANIKAYLMASPLKEHLSKLRWFDVQDLLGLNLQLDIPLYPERDQVFARGAIFFDDNSTLLHLFAKDIVFDHMTGVLRFDEHGLNGGGLQGTLAGEPINIQVQTILNAKPLTEIKLQTTATLEYLRQKFALPLLALFEGHFNLEGVITLPVDAQEDEHIHLASTLEGVAVDLPKPLGKTSQEAMPLALDLSFHANKNVELELNYLERLNGRALLSSVDDHLELQKGELRLGTGNAVMPKNNGIHVVGTLSLFDMSQWQAILAKLSSQNSYSSFLDNIKAVDLKFSQVLIGQQHFDHVAIKANKLTQDEWAIQLEQANVAARLRYQLKRRALSGDFDRLYFDSTMLEKQHHNITNSALKPKDIPNLDINVARLKWNDVDVGQVKIQSTSTNAQWQLNNCQVQTPEYQLHLQGNWINNEQKNRTALQGNLKINDLSKSLERWHITPAVQAKKGDIQFEGEWPGSVLQFQLPNVSGDMQIIFKNGRISHFDRETESKLGLGKLLSILSLQTIPRRLQLDFSDLSEQGYSFDIFKGHFKLFKGIMSTQDSYIDGPVAYASMHGDLNLSQKLYDLDLRVSPYIGASLPVVATIAGGPVAGPIAGIATWVALNIINKGMQKISGYSYKISGPWLDPIVQQVSIDRKK